MKLTPPKQTEGRKLSGANLRTVAVFAFLLALLSGWQLFGLPGSSIKKYEPPFDMPWFGFGVKQLAVDSEGVWHIARQGYADRAAYYRIVPGHQPEKFGSIPVELMLKDTSGNMNPGAVHFAGGRLNLKTSRSYWAWRYRLKNIASTPREQREAYDSDGTGDTIGPSVYPEPSITMIYSNPGRNEMQVLAGHQHYNVFDAAAAIAPNVWVTTNRGLELHRLVARDGIGSLQFDLVASTNTILEERLEHNATLGYLRESNRLFMLSPDGKVDYYDPLTLEYLESAQLAGDWRREYANLLQPGKEYSFYQGQPLAEGAYKLLMRSLVIVFLASVLTLIVAWSKSWTSTSDQTTEDTQPSLS